MFIPRKVETSWLKLSWISREMEASFVLRCTRIFIGFVLRRSHIGHSPTPTTRTRGRPTSTAHMRVASVSTQGLPRLDEEDTAEKRREPLRRARDPQTNVTPPADPGTPFSRPRPDFRHATCGFADGTGLRSPVHPRLRFPCSGGSGSSRL